MGLQPVFTSYALLATSVVALLLGPLAYALAEKDVRWRSFVDGLAVVSVGGLALLRLAPEAVAEGGFIAVLLILVGAVVPNLLHKFNRRGSTIFTDGILIGSLVVHAAVESAALGTHVDPTTTLGLGLAITAHRLPVGLAVFSVPEEDRVGWLAIFALVLATLGGFAFGQGMADSLTETQDAYLHAIVCGSLLHVLGGHQHGHRHGDVEDGHGHAHGHGHSHGHAHGAPEPQAATSSAAPQEQPDSARAGTFIASRLIQRTGESTAAGIGALIGLLLIGTELTRDSHSHHHEVTHVAELGFTETFLQLALESAPALLAGYLLAGLLTAVLKPRHAQWLRGGGRLMEASKGVAFGLPLPICSCGILPIYEALVKRGVPAAAALAFLVATPELGLDALLLSIPLLGGDLAIARLVGAFVVALAAGVIVSRFVRSSSAPEPEPTEETQAANEAQAPKEDDAESGPLSQRLGQGLRFGLVELFDHTVPWVLVGLLVAAIVEPLLGHEAFQTISPWAQVPLFALLGVPTYVCASGATPLAAIAIHKGISSGAALAFLIAGPATNITTFGVLTRLHGRRTALVFAAVLVVSAVALGWTVDALNIGAADRLSEHHLHDPSLLQTASLALLGLLLLASLFRHGPRGLLRQVTSPDI